MTEKNFYILLASIIATAVISHLGTLQWVHHKQKESGRYRVCMLLESEGSITNDWYIDNCNE